MFLFDRKKLTIFFSLLLIFSSVFARAELRCEDLFLNSSPSKAVSVGSIVIEDAFEQWRLWEELGNRSPFRQTTEIRIIRFSTVPMELVRISEMKGLDPTLHELLVNGDGTVNWPRHLYNTSKSVPFSRRKKNDKSARVRLTASRSLDLVDTASDKAYTIKIPTNYPHGRRRREQISKINNHLDVRLAIPRSRLLNKMDSEFQSSGKVIVAREVMAVGGHKSGNGFTIRDNSYLKDGNYYLPAFSLPFVGRKIAELFSADPAEFWAEHFAKVLGKAKAEILLHYGLEFDSPNAQNILIQLDRNLRPTGVLVFRDITDTSVVLPVAQGLGLSAEIEQEIALAGKDYGPKQTISPNAKGSIMSMLRSDENSFTLSDIKQWIEIHNSTYLKEVAAAVGLSSSESITIERLNDFIQTDLAKQNLTKRQKSRGRKPN